MRTYRSLAAAALAVLGLTLSACGASTPGAEVTTSGSGSSNAATATSVADLGGMDKLVEAAKAEGQLNVIALPRDWANYGAVIDAFKAKYGITVNEQSPDASSKEEIAAADANKGTDKAPDVFDLGTNIALTSTDYFAPYKVEQWDKIPADNKEATGLWVNDYTGVMVVGYNKTKFGELTSLDQLTDAKFAGTVALSTLIGVVASNAYRPISASIRVRFSGRRPTTGKA